ncbi:MAG: hypothetical protein ACXADL_12180 [Candidatus Thorarchaeota archaeon]|jgi:hypothetical protein
MKSRKSANNPVSNEVTTHHVDGLAEKTKAVIGKMIAVHSVTYIATVLFR